jgi:hypothetical protein
VAHKRGTLAQIVAAAALSQLKTGEVYLITDESRLTVATAANAHQPAAKQGEGGGSDPWTWVKLGGNVANSTVTLAPVTGLSFTALPLTTYLVEVIGAFQSAALTTGMAIALDIPSGSIIGQPRVNISATAMSSLEQIADNATTGVSTGVRALANNVPVTGKFIVAVGAVGGTVQLQFRSEVAASAITMQANLTAMGYRSI